MATNLKQSDSKVQIAGVLSSKDLEEIVDKNGNKGIRGSLTIKVDDTNSIRVGVYVGEKTSRGEENKAWAGINTVKNEFKAITDVGEEAADFIYTNASFNTYRNQNGQDVTNYKSNYFSRAKTRTPMRKFKVEAFVKGVSPEVDNQGEETGRLKLTVIEPTFNGINILEVMVPEALAEAVDNNIELGATYRIDGEIVNSRVEKTTQALIGTLGSDTVYKNELILTGTSDAYENDREYDAEAIKLALQEYETAQNEAQARKAAQEAKEAVPFTKPSGASSGRSLNF